MNHPSFEMDQPEQALSLQPSEMDQPEQALNLQSSEMDQQEQVIIRPQFETHPLVQVFHLFTLSLTYTLCRNICRGLKYLLSVEQK